MGKGQYRQGSTYRCDRCGNVIYLVQEGGGNLVCCVKALRVDPEASSPNLAIPVSAPTPPEESISVRGASRVSPDEVEPVDVFSLRGVGEDARRIFTRKICEGGASDVSMLRLPYGQDEEEHLHRDQDHVLVLMEGRGEVHLDGRVIEVMTGATLLVPRGVSHQIKNTSSTDLVVLEIGNG